MGRGAGAPPSGGDAYEALRASCRDTAAVQIYIDHGTVVTQEDLKVGLQSRVRLRHACNQSKVTLYALAELDLIGCVLNEAVDAPLK
eukprot:scaffold48270_cov69-Phaeocystis_antarctica.AAC.5